MTCRTHEEAELSSRVEQYEHSPHSAFALPSSTHHWIICQNNRGPQQFLVQAEGVEHDASDCTRQQIIYLPPGTKTQWEFSPVEGSTHLLIPDKLLLQTLGCERSFANILEQGPLLGALMPELSSLINSRHKYLKTEQGHSSLALSDLVIEATDAFARGVITNANKKSAPSGSRESLGLTMLRTLEDYMWDNIERNITLAELAQVAHLSPFHFARKYKEETQRTPHQALLRIRVRKARVLLSGSQTLTEISYSCGFSDQAHFTRVFQSLTGFTPKQFRKATT